MLDAFKDRGAWNELRYFLLFHPIDMRCNQDPKEFPGFKANPKDSSQDCLLEVDSDPSPFSKKEAQACLFS